MPQAVRHSVETLLGIIGGLTILYMGLHILFLMLSAPGSIRHAALICCLRDYT